MYPTTPPATDLSRPRLKALTRWIRDDLDLIVAREGPNSLCPDDVLTIHETLLQLRLASNITVLDLRATGIHRAVQDIAGVATRWPGKLCDDCDKIIALWTEKFGPFSALHPFMYGRGGRLEGIASATEYSREALLKRWSKTCPDKVHPKRSHRLGDLDFRAGDWWINTLFAHHAGIIGLEAVEGGTTFDKHGAYAVVLKDTGEVEAHSEEHFTYRVPQNDKGKFRLTAATPQSRDPIRVLRSHSINSVWGPKAGVRYEGLYAVKGWSIRQAKTTDLAGGEWKEGDIIFEVGFERKDAVPMEEVIKRPTATEVDDYSEYKRLRKIHREGKRKVPNGSPYNVKADHHIVRAAPQIPPLQPLDTIKIPKPTLQEQPYPSVKSLFRRPHFDLPELNPHKQQDVVSPGTVPDTDDFPLVPRKCSTLAVPTHTIPHVQRSGDTSHSDSQLCQNSGTYSNLSSEHTGVLAQPNIREVAPWIDFDASLTLPSPDYDPPIIREKPTPQSLQASLTKSTRNTTRPATQRRDSPPLSTRRLRRKSSNSKNLTTTLSPNKTKDSRKSIFTRSRNPLAKILDGAASTEGSDSISDTAPHQSSPSPTHKPPRHKQRRTSSIEVEVYSPIPVRPFSPDTSPLYKARRGAISTADDNDDDDDGGAQSIFPILQGDHVHCGAAPLVVHNDACDDDDDVFNEALTLRGPVYMPLSLKKSLSKPMPAVSTGSGTLTTSVVQGGMDSGAGKELERGVGGIVFRDPFRGGDSRVVRGGVNRAQEKSDCGGGVGPDEVV